MLKATELGATVFFTNNGETSNTFEVRELEVVSVDQPTNPTYSELSVMLPGYGHDRGAWLCGDAIPAVSTPGSYLFAVDLADPTMEFRAVRGPQGRWHRVHNANPGVMCLQEWPVNRW